jgi:hypothetical protein
MEMIKEEMGPLVDPIGPPLTAGPRNNHHLASSGTPVPDYFVVISFVLNLIIVWVIFILSSRNMHFLGRGGVRRGHFQNIKSSAGGYSRQYDHPGVSLLGVLNVRTRYKGG